MPDVASVLEEEELLAKGGREQKIGELKNGLKSPFRAFSLFSTTSLTHWRRYQLLHAK